MKSKLIAIGAGPKAIALAAKAAALRQLGYAVPDVIIVEKDSVAANWHGAGGFTDGSPTLGTPAEKDCGFPYSSSFGPEVDSLMLKDYSWPAYLIQRREYADRVDRGRPQPTHGEWAQYLAWVCKVANPKIMIGPLREITIRNNTWRIGFGAGRRPQNLEANGLVITGPGEPIEFEGQQRHRRIFNGRDFWKSLPLFKKLRDCTVGVIGGGETAAAIVVALVQSCPRDVAIQIITRHGAVFSRGESFDENRWFTDPSEWYALSEEHRSEIIERADRGVFSVQSKRVIDLARNVQPLTVDVSRISIEDGVPVIIARDNEKHGFDYLIVASGFEPLWFAKMMNCEAREICCSRDKVARRIQSDLSVGGVTPRLHLPMLASLQQGPGFPNLSCLGLLSDRILGPYTLPRHNRGRLRRG